jgi:tRNA G37 N-methylase Trm5
LSFERNPHDRLLDAVSEALLHLGIEEDVVDAATARMPRRWERFDDFLLLRPGDFQGGPWTDNTLLEVFDDATAKLRFWTAVAAAVGANRVGRKGEISGDERRPLVEMLLGTDDSIIRKENGIQYCYKVTKSMFSMGNVEERRRMGEVKANGETVLDLYAGIGYYTLPLLVHAGAARVIACEWSEDAISALQAGLSSNDVEVRCTILAGDNRGHSLHNIADRVVAGLLPNAWDGLPTALAALRQSGGIIHLHGTAKRLKSDDGYSEWLTEAVQRCMEIESELAASENRRPRTIAPIAASPPIATTPSHQQKSVNPDNDDDSNVILIKSYSPHWDHVVADLRIAN